MFNANMEVYGRSKLCNILFTIELANRLKNTSVTSYSLHPGVVATDIFRTMPPLMKTIVACVISWFFKVIKISKFYFLKFTCKLYRFLLRGLKPPYIAALPKELNHFQDNTSTIVTWLVDITLPKIRRYLDCYGKKPKNYLVKYRNLIN